MFMLWSPEHALGIPHLDAQHQALFSAIERIRDALSDPDPQRNRRICEDGLKFLERHALEHFSAEEGYMRSIGYSRYESHKRQHEAITRQLTVIRDDIIASDYAPRAIKTLLGTLLSWLVYHTIEIDAGIGANPPSVDLSSDAEVALEGAVTRVISDMFRFKPELARRGHDGTVYGGEVICLASCGHLDGRRFRLLTAVDEHALLHGVGTMLSQEQKRVDELSLAALEELCSMLCAHFAHNYQSGEFFHIEGAHVLSHEELAVLQPDAPVLASLLFDSAHGSFLFRVW